jgi:hypothetical protein
LTHLNGGTMAGLSTFRENILTIMHSANIL